MPDKVTEVTFTVDAQAQEGMLFIPEEVRDSLKIAEGEYPLLVLVLIDAETGNILIDDGAIFQMTEDYAIFDARTNAILESHKQIQVRVSLAKQG